MSLSETCIKRPIFASVLSLILVLFGIVGYFRLPVSELPHIEFPIISITTKLAGASSEIIDETVTEQIEAAINTLEGVKHIKSKSFEGLSFISVQFDKKNNINQAAQDCRDTIARIRHTLPNDIEEPTVTKLDINAFPVMWIAVSSPTLQPSQITHYADKTLKEKLQRVKGVGSILFGGEKKYALRMWLDPNRLYAHKLTVSDVVNALKDKNIELPSGRIEGVTREFSIKTNGTLDSLDSLRMLNIAQSGSTPIALSDIGWIEEGIEDDRSLARYTAEDAVGIGIIKQPAANTIEVAKALKKEIEKINQTNSQNIHIKIAFDSSEFIQKSIDEVKETLWSAGFFVVFCIFIFLRNFRSTFIPALAIPISIISTFSVMYFLGFTLNSFTLLALVLAIGVVVDDAIVMLENIFRHIENGKKRFEAAVLGAKEMALPIISSSLALVSVFVPIALMEGQVGQFFFEFSMTVAIAIIVSAFVSLTLTPMLCSQLLVIPKRDSKIFNFFEKFYTRLEIIYKIALKKVLKQKYLSLFVASSTVIASVFILAKIGKEFAPEEDRGSFIISLQAPEGSTLSYTDHYLKEIEKMCLESPYIEGFFSALALSGAELPAVNKGLMFVQLIKDRKRPSAQTIISQLRQELTHVTGVKAWPMTFNPFSQGRQAKPFEYILANDDYEELKQHVHGFVNALQDIVGFKDVDSDLQENRSQINLTIDREKAADLGVSIQNISTTLNYLLAGKESTKFKKAAERYPVIVQIAKELARTPEILRSIYLRSSDGNLVRLDNIATFSEGVGPTAIHRLDRKKVTTISANLEGITLKEAIEKANELSSTTLPNTFTSLLSGEAEEMIATFMSFLFTLLLAVIIIYLILSAQFESFIYPIIIMSSLPLSLIGALGGLYLAGMTINIYSLIGTLMLMGLVTKNAILLVDCTNQLKQKGMDINEALCEAGRLRLRPILMTATSTVLGIIPLALSLGAGSESRRPLGVCVIGGMFSATLLTLFIIPSFYLVLDSLVKKISRAKLRLLKFH